MDPLGRFDFLREAIDRRRCVVAESDGMVVGFVVTTPHHFFGHDFVDLLAVREESRRRGIGTGLLHEAVGRAHTPRVFSSTNVSNAPMRGLFAAAGWTPSGELVGLDEGDPELVFFVDRSPEQLDDSAPSG